MRSLADVMTFNAKNADRELRYFGQEIMEQAQNKGPLKDDALKAYLDAEKIALMPQQQYFDSYSLNARGVTAKHNSEVKKKLGFSEAQKFSKAMHDAVRMVASTSLGDDCGEGVFGST